MDAFAFASTLSEGGQRFLARVVEHALSHGRRTASDFVRHFPPSSIMKGLEHNPELRAAILVATTGVREKIALRKSWEDAAADLDLAMDEGETNADAIVELFAGDDRVRYLEAPKLWDFLREGEFWRSADADEMAVAQSHVAYLLESALEEGLLSERDVVDALTVRELSDRLPREELGALLVRALQNAERGVKFTEADLLAATPPRVLVQHVPLSQIWDTVVRPCIAQRQGFEPGVEAMTSPTVVSSPATPDRRDAPVNVVPIAVKTAAPAKLAASAKPKALAPTAASVDNRVSRAANDPFDDDAVTRVFEDDDDTSVFELIEDDAKAV